MRLALSPISKTLRSVVSLTRRTVNPPRRPHLHTSLFLYTSTFHSYLHRLRVLPPLHTVCSTPDILSFKNVSSSQSRSSRARDSPGLRSRKHQLLCSHEINP